MEYNINCPLMEEMIDNGTCFDISMVAEDMAPKWSIPEKAAANPKLISICMTCENHKKE